MEGSRFSEREGLGRRSFGSRGGIGLGRLEGCGVQCWGWGFGGSGMSALGLHGLAGKGLDNSATGKDSSLPGAHQAVELAAQAAIEG